MSDDHQQPSRVHREGGTLLLTAQDVAALLKVRVSWIYDQVEAGRFPVVRLGRQLRFRKSDVLEYVDDNYRAAHQWPDIRHVRTAGRRAYRGPRRGA